MTLFNYYSVDECKEREKIFGKLNQLRDDGKIEYEMIERDIFKLEDLDLEEIDIEDLNKLFDSNDVFPYLDHNDEDDKPGYDDEYSDGVDY